MMNFQVRLPAALAALAVVASPFSTSGCEERVIPVTQASMTAEHSSSAGVGTKTVAVVGATGAVGAEMLRCLEESSYPTGTLKAFAS